MDGMSSDGFPNVTSRSVTRVNGGEEEEEFKGGRSTRVMPSVACWWVRVDRIVRDGRRGQKRLLSPVPLLLLLAQRGL